MSSYQHVLSLLELEEMHALGGLPGEAIAGVYLDQSHSLQSFRQNSVFVAFLHLVIGGEAARSPELIEAAKDMPTGHLVIMDWRTPDPQGGVPPEDIIGVIAVKNGVMVENSYQANPNYRVLTSNGMTRLTPHQRSAFVAALPRVGPTDT